MMFAQHLQWSLNLKWRRYGKRALSSLQQSSLIVLRTTSSLWASHITPPANVARKHPQHWIYEMMLSLLFPVACTQVQLVLSMGLTVRGMFAVDSSSDPKLGNLGRPL